MSQITTLTFFNYHSISAKFWAFGMMQFAHKQLQNIAGLQLYKLMGSGKGNGFNPWPDWSTYAIIQIWDDEQSAVTYFTQSRLHQQYKTKAQNIYTIYLKNIIAKGVWNGKNPFTKSESLDPNNQKVAILTRATIKPSKLKTFWDYVPTSEKHLKGAKGLLYTKGIGEVPLFQMATFSIWDSIEDMQAFAYKGPEHRVAIQKTRDLDWYSEELFARFQVTRIEGKWL
jgi:heme-degrading monooxygenase HmoA